MSVLSTLGARIRELRMAKKLTQEDMGDIMGVKKSAVSGIEVGRTFPALEGFIKLIEKYQDIDVEWLLLGKGDMIKSDPALGTNSVSIPDAKACWEELQKEQSRFNQLLADHQELQNKLKDMSLLNSSRNENLE